MLDPASAASAGRAAHPGQRAAAGRLDPPRLWRVLGHPRVVADP
jgi:hypothetical protein